MPHVELSLIDSRRPARPRPAGPRRPTPGALGRWAAVVASAGEPCMVVDTHSVIIAASASAAELLQCGDLATSGRPLRDALAHLVDFADPPDRLDSADAGKLPPLLAISSKQLARGLIRIAGSGKPCILDSVATPLWDGATVAGSLSFFSPVRV